MTSWRTNLGGAISVTGTSLLAVGILPQLSQFSPSTTINLTPHELDALWFVALAGFVLSGIGKGFTALFAADVTSLKSVSAEVDRINALGSDPNSKPLLPEVPVKPNPPIQPATPPTP